MAAPSNGRKMAALMDGMMPPKSTAPPPTGGEMIGLAMRGYAAQANNGTDPVPSSRMPVGVATGKPMTMTQPPAAFSVNTTPGAPRRSARGKQYEAGGD